MWAPSTSAKLGKSLYDVVPGIERGDREDVIVGTAEEVIRPGAADIVVVCTNSFTRDVYDKLVFVMERGMNVITSAEEMAYPQAQEPELAAKLDEIARRNGVTVLGTGINPGLIMDLLVILWTGACERGSHRLPPGEQPVSLRPRRHGGAGYRPGGGRI